MKLVGTINDGRKDILKKKKKFKIVQIFRGKEESRYFRAQNRISFFANKSKGLKENKNIYLKMYFNFV